VAAGEGAGSSVSEKWCKTTKVSHTMPFSVSDLHNLLILLRRLENLEAGLKPNPASKRQAFPKTTELAEQYSPTKRTLRAVL